MNGAKWWFPIVLMLLLTPFTPQLDLAIAHSFYHDGHFVSNGVTAFMYHYATFPAWLLFAAAAVAFLLSYCFSFWKRWRAPALVVLLTLVVGSGILTHALFKDHWGRPRPKQVVEFGGTQPFYPYYSPNFFHQPESSKSFACGHCTMGFYFFALVVLGKRLRNSWLYYGGLFLALLLGIALSITRMAQGGHFFSDTVAAALIMWLTAVTCDWLIYAEEEG
jgi:lipid A 4'-phosphatase